MDLHFEEHNNQSLKRFEKMLKTDSVYFFDSVEFERIVQFYIDSGKTNLANKALSLAIDQHPNNIGLSILKAELFIIEERFDDADLILEAIEAIEPSNEDVFIQKASLLSKKNKHEEAIAVLNNAIDIAEETNVDLLLMVAMEYLYLENFEKALLYFRNSLEINQGDFTTLYNIVYCYDMLEKPLAAISFLEAHLENNPYNETAWHQLGRQYAITENYTKAISSFDFAIAIDDTFVGAYIEKAKILEEQKDFSQAINNYLITTELEDPTPFAFERIAAIFEKINKPRKALEYYHKAYDLDPSLEKSIVSLASLYYSISDYDKAISYIQKLLAINPKDTYYWKIYADANSQNLFYKEAINSYKKCLDLNENTLEIHTALSDNYYHLGDFQNAIATLLKAEVYYYQRPEIEYRLAGLYLQTNKPTIGITYLTKALTNNKDQYRFFQKQFPFQHTSDVVQKTLRKYFSE